VVLLISNDLRCFSAVFLHYILQRFRTAWQTESQVGQQHRDIFLRFATVRSRTGNSRLPRFKGTTKSIDLIVPNALTNLRALFPSPLLGIHICKDIHSADSKNTPTSARPLALFSDGKQAAVQCRFSQSGTRPPLG
jgi:hypothetical protein